MKNKGFTMIELLAILVILPVLFLIAYPAISGYIESTGNRYYKTLEESVKISAVDFAADNNSFLPKGENAFKKITIDQIIKYGEMEKVTDKEGNPCEEGFVIIERTGAGANEYEYTVCLTCGEYKTENTACAREDTKYLVNYILKHENKNGKSYKEGTWSSTNIYQEFSNNMLYGVKLDTYQRQLNDGSWEDFSGNSFILEETTDVKVRAIDIDGNISEPVSYKVLIDKNPITITSKATTTDFIYQSTNYRNTTISDLFTFGSFGPSGGTITCTAGENIVYKNNNGTVEVNKKVSEFGLTKRTTITCSSETGAGLKRDASTIVTITAKSTTTLNANGGIVSPSSIEVIYGEKYPALPTPSRQGYDFIGWYTSQTGGSQITSETIVNTTANQTIYAHWTAKKYTITFDSNGGTPSNTTKEVTYDSKYGDLPEPTRPGYTFDGWYTEDGEKITENDIVKITEDTKLIAKWSANEYTVTLNPNGGTVSPTSTKVVYGKTYESLPTPTRTGYTFVGWFTTATGGTEIKETSLVQITSDQTIYAHWNKNSYTLTINPNGGTWNQTTSNSSFTIGYQGTKTIANPSRTGYTFKGWTITGTGSSMSGTTFTMGSSNTTLTATWEKNSYTLTINPNGGTWNSTTSNSSFTIEYKGTKTIANPSRTGYTFKGWTITGTGSSMSGTTFTMGSKNTTLTATWEKNSYTLTINPNGGTWNSTTSNSSFTIEYQGTKTIANPSRTGYTFKGWTITGTGSSMSGTTFTMGSKNTTLTATWEKNSYTLTINPNGGTWNQTTSNSSFTIEYQGTKTIANPSRTGYAFNGWTITGTGSSMSGTTFKMGSSNTTLTAKWTPLTFTVTFNANGGTLSGSSSKTVTNGSTYGTLPTATRTGYAFAGWYTSTSGGTQVTNATVVNLTANQTLYARWTYRYLAEATIEDNGGRTAISAKGNPTFGSQWEDPTYGEMYAMADDNGTSYYFRGMPTNSWVSFGGFYWRIVRVNGDGSTRLIYAGRSMTESEDDDVVAQDAFNWNFDKVEYHGYMYTEGQTNGYSTESNAKTLMDKWYKDNLYTNYHNYVADTIYCADRSGIYETGKLDVSETTYESGVHFRTSYSNQPTLKCASKNDRFTVNNTIGNQALTYPVGMINADEGILAGINSWRHSDDNYLIINRTYFTMSPWGYGHDNLQISDVITINNMGGMGNTIRQDGNGNLSYMRPVISLKSTVRVSGIGTQANPYIVRSVD